MNNAFSQNKYNDFSQIQCVDRSIQKLFIFNYFEQTDERKRNKGGVRFETNFEQQHEKRAMIYPVNDDNCDINSNRVTVSFARMIVLHKDS